MQITFLGHAGFRIEIEGAVLLIDPWLDRSPIFPEDRRDEAIDGATHILITHGHGDHAASTLSIAKEKGIPIVAIHELATFWGKEDGIETLGFGKGGTVDLNGAKVTMVNASHSSSFDYLGGDRPLCAGSETGFMIAGEGHVIYLSGDTDIMADMEWMGDLHKPDIGILCAGGHYTMDMARAAYAANRYFDFKTVIPCHYKTFPILAQSADELIAALPNVNVIEPELLKPITI
ncbi:L-ascorbate metabolism protein UlaG, beta-lactamase superfamily [Aliiroseovarius halocynthiae]|uniref:Metal-dependent hydrolase n=1 Tax=Aliiroseovarius halocynthiae TaxID=985055 RepID=A0A545STV1_9RHOB|nr:metal-dependent hydrolase [Aliiroseovarius halocynthiae]TQV68386.1 metal-dependent hydrolase [Aliiroseovarius halocynthiae]SMR70776.1 L-ascorbate metabolism protein UlaG, beta-lactamase superfamily [Aliiroseovarius halocynthiae]